MSSGAIEDGKGGAKANSRRNRFAGETGTKGIDGAKGEGVGFGEDLFLDFVAWEHEV
jgi:hypothetical protein